LQQIRDEAHRFAQHYHHVLRRKRTFDEDVKQGRRPPKATRGKRAAVASSAGKKPSRKPRKPGPENGQAVEGEIFVEEDLSQLPPEET